MNAAPFLAAPLATQLHRVGIVAAFLLGTWLLVRRKGTPTPRLLGRIWMGLMLAVALASFLITGHAGKGHLSWIHGLSALVIFNVVMAVWSARTGRIRAHRNWVLGTYAGAFLGAGTGALMPGRLISQILGYA